MATSFGGVQREVSGPDFLGSSLDARPRVWINNIRWQKLGALISDNAELRSLLSKKKVTLVNDDGVESKSTN
jgi:hypothetical protein